MARKFYKGAKVTIGQENKLCEFDSYTPGGFALVKNSDGKFEQVAADVLKFKGGRMKVNTRSGAAV